MLEKVRRGELILYNQNEIESIIKTIREALTPELPHLDQVGYKTPFGFYFTLKREIYLDPF
jgi:hypothetical protein